MRKESVIVIDDDQDFLKSMSDALRKMGLDVQILLPSRSLIEQVENAFCDLLITDVLMPDVDGLEVIRAFRRTKQQVPVIAMSGGGEMLPAATGLQFSQAFGATRILVKPFTMRELKDAIAELLPSAGAPSDY